MSNNTSITKTLRANYNKRIRELLKALADIDNYMETCYKDDPHTIYKTVTEITKKAREKSFKEVKN